MLKLKIFQFNMFGENTFILYDSDTLEAAVIDPGMMDPAECHQFDTFVADNNLKIKYLINTHLHVDHVMGDVYVESRYGVELSASVDDLFLAERVAEQARMFHLKVDVPDHIKIGHPLAEGDKLSLGNTQIEILAVPGHSPGSIALYIPSAGILFSGDALFRYSIGRTDLPGGNHSQLIKSITDKLLTLPEKTKVYPGHGPSTTIGEEARFNPFI